MPNDIHELLKIELLNNKYVSLREIGLIYKNIYKLVIPQLKILLN